MKILITVSSIFMNQIQIDCDQIKIDCVQIQIDCDQILYINPIIL